jgi:hypothetical protein
MLSIDKLGKKQAENDYLQKVVPLLKVRSLVAEHFRA